MHTTFLLEKLKRIDCLGTRSQSDGNIKIDLRELDCENMNQIELV